MIRLNGIEPGQSFLHLGLGPGEICDVTSLDDSHQRWTFRTGFASKHYELTESVLAALVPFDQSAFFVVRWHKPDDIQECDEILLGSKWFAVVHPSLASMGKVQLYRLFADCWIRRLAGRSR